MIDKSILLDNKKFTLGIFDDSDKLLHAVKTLKSKGVKIFDCYTPFPVHHLDKELGYDRTNLTVGAFLCGLLGSLSGFTLGYYMNVVDWPMIIGGKPDDIKMFTSFIPIIFELTILFTAFGMVIMFFARSRMVHGIKEDLLHARQTNDRLVLAIDDSVEQQISNSEIQQILKDEGAVEVDSGKEAFNTSHTDHDTPAEPKTVSTPKATDEPTEKRAELSEEAKAEKLNLLSTTLGTAEEGVKDDLKKISGVGPVYEKTLNGIGIYTFEQVSKLTPETIEAIEELTGYFPGRIERDNWIGQAKDLMNN